ncbi:MAG TPA: hypothetical protein VFC45_02755 [Pseudolabrys sp.]|nr:hypothetical protein [Pseudolabrys sp.]
MAHRHQNAFDLMISLSNANLHTGMTLWKRLPMLAAPVLHRSELNRMVGEKVAAVMNGMVEAQQEMMRLTTEAMCGRIEFQDLANASVSVAAASMRPAFRAVKANSRRLSRRA